MPVTSTKGRLFVLIKEGDLKALEDISALSDWRSRRPARVLLRILVEPDPGQSGPMAPSAARFISICSSITPSSCLKSTGLVI